MGTKSRRQQRVQQVTQMKGPEIYIEFWRYNPLENGHLEDQKRTQYNNSLALRNTDCQNQKRTELPIYHIK